MGYSRHLFLEGERIGEFECDICYDVMKDPVMCGSCEHVFCKSCIQTWMTTSNTCPACRDKINGLRTPCRPYLNLYGGLKLRCCFYGCGQVFDLDQIKQHYKCCEHNPDAIKLCAGSCGASIKMKDIRTHDCCVYLKSKLEERDLKINQLEKQLKFETTNTNTFLQWLGQIDNDVNVLRAGYTKIIRSKDKECSDLLARKNDEIENIKKIHVEAISSKDLKTNIVLVITAALSTILLLNIYKKY